MVATSDRALWVSELGLTELIKLTHSFVPFIHSNQFIRPLSHPSLTRSLARIHIPSNHPSISSQKTPFIDLSSFEMSAEPWSTRIQQEFTHIPENCDDKDWHPAWCALLTSIFTLHDGFMIAPCAYFSEVDTFGEGNPAYMIQTLEGVSILGLEIRKASDVECSEKRHLAVVDSQDKIRDATPSHSSSSSASSSTIPQFRMICAIGTRCCVFTKETATGIISPTRIKYQDHLPEPECAPLDWWNIDIANSEGKIALSAYFKEAKMMAYALPRRNDGLASLDGSDVWPSRLRNLFSRLASKDSHTVERWYAPYWALLAFVFPVEEGYRVVPQIFSAAHWRREYIEDAVVLVVENEARVPVVGLEARRPEWVRHRNDYSHRAFFDREIRSRFRVMGSPLPKFHLVSSLGTHCCVYTYDQAARSISPPKLPARGPFPDTAPLSRWSLDLCTREGRWALNAYFVEAKEMSSSLFAMQ